MGTLKTGDRLPSVRALARQYRADARTVLATYRLLAVEGLVFVRPRSGTEVAAVVAAHSHLPRFGPWLVDFLTAGLPYGIGPSELRRQARHCLDTVTLEAVCVECNFDQLHALCWELQRDYEVRSQALEVDALGSSAALDALGRADLVVTTRFHERVLKEALGSRAAALLVVSLDPSFRSELARTLAGEPVYFLCTDPRFAAKLTRMFEGQGDTRPVVLGRDDIEDVPPRARVYATPRALQRLPARWKPRVVCASRIFSVETARELVAHVVRVNLRAVGGGTEGPGVLAATPGTSGSGWFSPVARPGNRSRAPVRRKRAPEP